MKPQKFTSLQVFQEQHQLEKTQLFWNLPPETLIDHSLKLPHVKTTDSGAIAVRTGQFTGRSPENRFIVLDDITKSKVDWSPINIAFSKADFEKLYLDLMEYIQQKKLYVQQVFIGGQQAHRLGLTVTTELPWSSLFVRNMFLSPSPAEIESFQSEWSVFCIPSFESDPSYHGTYASNFSVINFSQKMILIGGTAYTGEIKKGIFSALNFLLPTYKNILPMHCSANVGVTGDTALFFGLSGTGKTTLSSCAHRKLIGDDEHGWSLDNKIFNFEGGCYAKTIDLDPAHEPEIFQAIRSGALLENVKFVPDTDRVNYFDDSITENTRVSYPLEHLKNIQTPAIGEAPKNIFFLSCDAFGVLPPLSKLTPEQATTQFLLGYTAKIAGTEWDIQEPQAVFSACFGAPFMPLHPMVYGDLFEEKIKENQTQVWLVNTGWIKGPYGTGERIALRYTRALIDAVLENKISPSDFTSSSVFGFEIPDFCPEVPTELLNPRQLWDNPDAYDIQARKLYKQFEENIQKLRNQRT